METLGKYALLEQLVSSDVSDIFYGRPIKGGGPGPGLIIKRLRPAVAEDEAYVADFYNAAERWAQLDHDGVARVDDFGAEESHHYLAHSYVPGKDLKNLARRQTVKRRLLPQAATIYIVRRILEVLSHTSPHTTHGCLTPSDIIIGFSGEIGILNFGMGSHYARVGSSGGAISKEKAPYLAPEVKQGSEPDTRADVYSLGVVFYELLVGSQPTAGDQDGVIVPPSHARPSVFAELDELVVKMLATDPQERPDTFEAIDHALKDLEETEADDPYDEKKLAALVTQTYSNEVGMERERQALQVPDALATQQRATSNHSSPSADRGSWAAAEASDPVFQAPEREGAQSSKKVWVFGGTAALVLVALGLVFYLGSNEGGGADVDGDVEEKAMARSTLTASESGLHPTEAEGSGAEAAVEPELPRKQVAEEEGSTAGDDLDDLDDLSAEEASSDEATGGGDRTGEEDGEEDLGEGKRASARASARERRAKIASARRARRAQRRQRRRRRASTAHSSQRTKKVAALTEQGRDDSRDRKREEKRPTQPADKISSPTKSTARSKPDPAKLSPPKPEPKPAPQPKKKQHGYLSVVTATPVIVDIDGWKTTVQRKTVKIKLTPGAHRVKVTFTQSGKSFRRNINISPGKNKVLRLVHGQ